MRRPVKLYGMRTHQCYRKNIQCIILFFFHLCFVKLVLNIRFQVTEFCYCTMLHDSMKNIVLFSDEIIFNK